MQTGYVADSGFEPPFARAPQFWSGGGLGVVAERFRVGFGGLHAKGGEVCKRANLNLFLLSRTPF